MSMSEEELIARYDEVAANTSNGGVNFLLKQIRHRQLVSLDRSMHRWTVAIVVLTAVIAAATVANVVLTVCT